MPIEPLHVRQSPVLVAEMPERCRTGVGVQVQDAVQQLNPDAQVRPCVRCHVSLQGVLGTARFDMSAATALPAWHKVRSC